MPWPGPPPWRVESSPGQGPQTPGPAARDFGDAQRPPNASGLAWMPLRRRPRALEERTARPKPKGGPLGFHPGQPYAPRIPGPPRRARGSPLGGVRSSQRQALGIPPVPRDSHHNPTHHNPTNTTQTQHNTTEPITTRHTTTRHNATQTHQPNTTRHNTTQHNTTQPDREHHNTPQPRGTPHNPTQAQPNTTHHGEAACA